MLDKTKSVADPDADLREAFKVFDLDGDGIITVINSAKFHIYFYKRPKLYCFSHFKKAKELKLVMHSLGQTVSGSDIEEMIKEADTNCNKSIRFNPILILTFN